MDNPGYICEGNPSPDMLSRSQTIWDMSGLHTISDTYVLVTLAGRFRSQMCVRVARNPANEGLSIDTCIARSGITPDKSTNKNSTAKIHK